MTFAENIMRRFPYHYSKCEGNAFLLDRASLLHATRRYMKRRESSYLNSPCHGRQIEAASD